MFPLFNYKKDADFDEKESWLAAAKMPEDIKIWTRIETNDVWNSTTKTHESVVGPKQHADYVSASDTKTHLLVFDNDKSIHGRMPYGVTNHRHTPEIEEQLGYAAGEPLLINFTPHLVPMNRGILATAYANLKPGVTGKQIQAAYEKYYADEYFIRLLEEGAYPETRWVEGSNFVDIGYKVDERTHRVVAMGVIDNLVKGAAGQAVQNMNLLFGLPEQTGLQLVPLFP